MQSKSREKLFFYILLAVVAGLTLAIFFKYLAVIFIGAALAVVLYPVFTKLNQSVTGNRAWASSLLTLLFFIVILGIPLFFLGAKVFSESSALYQSLSEHGFQGGMFSGLNAWVQSILPTSSPLNIEQTAGDIVSFLAGGASVVFASTLHTAFSFVLILLSLFYFLKDGEGWKKYVIELSPLSDEHDERILTLLGHAVNGVMLGYILVALIQGLLLGLGLFIFGVPNALLLGVLAGIASMIPSIGTALVSVPSVIYLFATGQTIPAILLLIWAALLVGTIDNFLSPVLVGNRIKLPALLILFAVLGGVSLLGPAGVILGPLTVSVLHTLIVIYKEDFEKIG